VVAAMQDPNPQVDGEGFQYLRKNGVIVDVGLLADKAREINRHYITFMLKKRPYICLKGGVSLDGKLTDHFRQSQWITEEEMRTLSHSFRGEFSAILAGVQTVIDDDPQLTLRETGWDEKPLFRVILDTQNRLDPGLNIFQDQGRFPLILFSANTTSNQTPKVNHHFFISPDASGKGVDLNEALRKLYEMGIASVLVEGGGRVFDSFLRCDLYDEIVLSTAYKLIGGETSVQFFGSGTRVSAPLILNNPEVTPLHSGCIIRGFR